VTSTRCVLVLLCVVGCGEDTPAGFVTEHLIVEPTDATMVCRGTLDDLEAQLVRVAAALDVEVQDPIDVYYGPSAVGEHCSQRPGVHVGGCTYGYGADTFIASEFLSLYHEIVHAVRHSSGPTGPSFFEEGLAVAFAGFRPFGVVLARQSDALPSEHGPAALARAAGRLGRDHYGTAGHFITWLIATYGQETVSAFLKDTRLADAVDEAFADHFAVTLEEAELDWRATSELQYALGQACYPERALRWDGDALEYAARLSCDEPYVLGPFEGDLIGTRGACFPLDRAGMLSVEMVAKSGEVTLRRQDDCLAVGPLSAEHYQDKRIVAGETLDAPFAPCTWEISVVTDLASPTDLALRLSR
jgi:hypothetical protein